MVDLTLLDSTLRDCAFAAVTAGIPIMGAFVKKHLDFIKNQQLKTAAGDAIDDLDNLASQGAGWAYNWLKQNSQSIDHPGSHGAAVDQGVAFVATMGPMLLATAGITPDTVKAKVTAELGKLLAVDPTVSVSSGTHTALIAGEPLKLSPGMSVTTGLAGGTLLGAGLLMNTAGEKPPAAA